MQPVTLQVPVTMMGGGALLHVVVVGIVQHTAIQHAASHHAGASHMLGGDAASMLHVPRRLALSLCHVYASHYCLCHLLAVQDACLCHNIGLLLVAWGLMPASEFAHTLQHTGRASRHGYSPCVLPAVQCTAW